MCLGWIWVKYLKLEVRLSWVQVYYFFIQVRFRFVINLTQLTLITTQLDNVFLMEWSSILFK